MAISPNLKRLGSSKKYKYVRHVKYGMNELWRAEYGKFIKCYQTERDAALSIDKYLISIGKEPINILVRSEKV